MSCVIKGGNRVSVIIIVFSFNYMNCISLKVRFDYMKSQKFTFGVCYQPKSFGCGVAISFEQVRAPSNSLGV